MNACGCGSLPPLQMASTDAVMAEVSLVSQQFTPFATTCSRAFFALQQLPELHFPYQISLGFFLQLVDGVLSSPASATAAAAGASDSAAELPGLVRSVVHQVFAHVGPSLLHEHKLVLALRLVQVSLAAGGVELDERECAILFKGATHTEPDSNKLAMVKTVLAGSGAMSAAQVKVSGMGRNKWQRGGHGTVSCAAVR